MINLKNIILALGCLGFESEHIQNAVDELTILLAELDDIEVKGRQNVDTLLGCMMAVESILGKDGENG